MKGARITIRCDCGELHYVDYGEIWQCPKCHRRWNTLQIPSDEYWGIMREMRQFRIRAMVVALSIGGVFAVLALTVSFSFFLILPIFMTGWYIYYMPRWRQRVRERARSLPEWTLRPE